MFKAIDALHPGLIEQPLTALWEQISPLYAIDESRWLRELMALAESTEEQVEAAESCATRLIEQVRADDGAIHMIDALLLEYSLDTREGILLMCLAEALMRVPDAETADALIRDKLSVADWKSHLKHSDSLLVNASTWGLLLTGKVVTMDEREDGTPSSVINRLVNRLGEPMIRRVMQQAMKIMGHQFVLGRDINEAMKRGTESRQKGYTYSFDMLGEAALTRTDAAKYLDDYSRAIDFVGNYQDKKGTGPKPSVSIKLSALHPRYEPGQEKQVMDELFQTVLKLIRQARALDVAITIDAEEADRLELSLQLFEQLYQHPDCQGWGGFGLVVQAYSKRALPVLIWLAALAKQQGDLIPVRLVKGAYWDSEIKLCQQKGLDGYPVFTRKEATDVSYLACARFLLSSHIKGLIWPQFASHNAHTVATIMTEAEHQQFEFQRLHGMGDALYDRVLEQAGVPVRIYAPVGNHKDLLPYLVRRLLENGANSSFVHRLVDARCPISDLTEHPWLTLSKRTPLHNPHIPLPRDIYGAERLNSRGPNIDIDSEWTPFSQKVNHWLTHQWQGAPIINGEAIETGKRVEVRAPYDQRHLTGEVQFADAELAQRAIEAASAGFDSWHTTPVGIRTQSLMRLGDLLEENLDELVALCHQEAGKTIQDGIDEVREAVDFCRYYALRANELFTTTHTRLLADGEQHTLMRDGRGVFVCISPWNFPLAIFLGQVTAALAAGNTVVAKPAEQTSLIATRAIELMLEAGVPASAIQLLPGRGGEVGGPLTSDPRIAGVAFTGSTETARVISRALAARDCAPVPLIAETGGQNAMIIDSTSLPEQVIKDAVQSAFASAGQRCSALRVLCVQSDIADRIIDLLQGAMAELKTGNPCLHSTDVGPVIDTDAQQGLLQYIEQMQSHAQLLAQTPLHADAEQGTFVPPTAFEIDSIERLGREQFGPIMHLVRYEARDLDALVDQINRCGYGLTLGIHSRNEGTAAHIEARARVGNTYINRNQVGATVGVQPFGGQGLSGTGPKAGGPHYLLRFTRLQPAKPRQDKVEG
ncbi:bifunctional proline dehydrogenase/L-glutamate gamma-semialdehyde dehydrogenase PutA [Marinobacterium sp. AK62]|uniref:Bifunctional protein PutA n=1 Tax=Marinobacterium alkalitolerans TaxID=1542925 RepID=A0ABS3ZDD3_9GAMM|nr:bifunctional proline dehydrogenase/L-glutamate gamma-semialdehyde dehydrogenase PutA [Marinobacterium alkalitolerans]MBP0049705.1 bifunctional proline dehydrogenase/L-glutamate gamma-semialdehyde dehydrogenase PutA [Marinobacterium alkalitolerans]